METNCAGQKEKRIPGIMVGESWIEEDNEILKKRISGHPLFALLIQAHTNCFKVPGLSEFGVTTTERGRHPATDSKSKNHDDIIHINPSDLDHFMEAYCMALRKLKEGIEEAQQESASFINATYLQLGSITRNNYL